MLSVRDAITPRRNLCRDPVRLFHPTDYDRACIADRVHELVSALYTLQRRHKALGLRHAPECHETAMCVLGYDHPLARLMEDDVDPTVRCDTITLLAPKNASTVEPSLSISPWIDALAVLCCEDGKPREFETLVRALGHSPAMQTERGTVWMLWLCALSCLVFPLDETHPLTGPLIDSVVCTLAHKTPPTTSFSPIQECVLTICFLASTGGYCGPLSPWQAANSPNDRDLRLEALMDNLSTRMAVGRSECLEG